MKRRWDWRGLGPSLWLGRLAVIAVVLGAMVYVGMAIAMLIADLRPLLTAGH